MTTGPNTWLPPTCNPSQGPQSPQDDASNTTAHDAPGRGARRSSVPAKTSWR